MKRIIALLLAFVICLSVFALTGCKKNDGANIDDANIDDISSDSDTKQEADLTLYAFCDDEQEYVFNVTEYEIQVQYGIISMPVTVGEKIGDVLSVNGYDNITPVESKGKFEGWMEYKEVTTTDADGFEQFSYEKVSGDTLCTTKQLLDRPMPEYNVMYVAKWDNLDYDYYAMMGY